MNIEIMRKVKPTNSTKETPNNNSNRIGFWGQVVNVDSISNTVDVIANTGMKWVGIPVMSRTWVCKNNNKKFVSADRFLPPVGSRVFVLTPSRSISGAFVLCSGIPTGDSDYHELLAKDNTEKNTKDNTYETVKESGWKIKENLEKGNLQFESPDGKIQIKLNVSTDTGVSKELNISAFGQNITIGENNLILQGKNGKLEIL